MLVSEPNCDPFTQLLATLLCFLGALCARLAHCDGRHSAPLKGGAARPDMARPAGDRGFSAGRGSTQNHPRHLPRSGHRRRAHLLMPDEGVIPNRRPSQRSLHKKTSPSPGFSSLLAPTQPIAHWQHRPPRRQGGRLCSPGQMPFLLSPHQPWWLAVSRWPVNAEFCQKHDVPLLLFDEVLVYKFLAPSLPSTAATLWAAIRFAIHMLGCAHSENLTPSVFADWLKGRW